jgi:16S rRNA (cytidine1402-2'-O)-methyltransferase
MTLFVVSTPIGNLGDATPRLRETFASAALILAEDTRRTRKLLTALSIQTEARVRSCHQHNETGRIEEALSVLERGDAVVLASDAGVPVVSDPGALVVEAVHAAGFEVRVVPGPSAVASALSVSGFPGVPHAFFGFAPRKGKARRVWLGAVLAFEGTAVVFEAPTRTARLVSDLAAADADRQVCLCRELTKLHEEVRRSSLSEMADELADRELKGEVTLVLAPGRGASVSPEDPERALRGQGAAAGALAESWGLTRQEVYEALSELKRTLLNDA